MDKLQKALGRPKEDNELDMLLDTLEYLRASWTPGAAPQLGLGSRLVPEEKPEFALRMARALDLAITRAPRGRWPAESPPSVSSLPMAPRPYASSMEQESVASLLGLGRAVQQQQSKPDSSLQSALYGSSAGSSAAAAPSSAPSSASKGRTPSKASPQLPPASFSSSSTPAVIQVPHVPVVPSVGCNGAEEDASMSTEGPLAETSLNRPLKPNMGFFEHKDWMPVRCAIVWCASKVGITVINATVTVDGEQRTVLLVSVVNPSGTGAEAGVRMGDCVVEVEGKNVMGLSCRDLLHSLKEFLRVKKHMDQSMTLNFVFARNVHYSPPKSDLLPLPPPPTSPRSSKAKSHAKANCHPQKRMRGGDIEAASSTASAAGFTYTLDFELKKFGSMVKFQPVTSDRSGRTYYIVADLLPGCDDRMQTGDILRTVDGEDVDRASFTGTEGMLRLELWRAHSTTETKTSSGPVNQPAWGSARKPRGVSADGIELGSSEVGGGSASKRLLTPGDIRGRFTSLASSTTEKAGKAVDGDDSRSPARQRPASHPGSLDGFLSDKERRAIFQQQRESKDDSGVPRPGAAGAFPIPALLHRQSSDGSYKGCDMSAFDWLNFNKPSAEKKDKEEKEPAKVVVSGDSGGGKPGGEGSSKSGESDKASTAPTARPTARQEAGKTLAASLMPLRRQVDPPQAPPPSADPPSKPAEKEEQQDGEKAAEPTDVKSEAGAGAAAEASENADPHPNPSEKTVDSVRNHADVGLAAQRRKAEHPEPAKPMDTPSDKSALAVQVTPPVVVGEERKEQEEVVKMVVDEPSTEKTTEAAGVPATAVEESSAAGSRQPAGENGDEAPDVSVLGATGGRAAKSPKRKDKAVDDAAGDKTSEDGDEAAKADSHVDKETEVIMEDAVAATDAQASTGNGQGSTSVTKDAKAEGKKRPLRSRDEGVSESKGTPGRAKLARLEGDQDVKTGGEEGKDVEEPRPLSPTHHDDHEKLSHASEDTLGASTAPDDGSCRSKADGNKHTWEAGEIAWGRIGKMPKWPLEVVEVKDGGDKGQVASVKFIGDAELTDLPVSVLEKFEMAFRKLWKRRYEKVYVKAVVTGTQRFLDRGGMELSDFCQIIGVQYEDLKGFMSEDALSRSWIEKPLDKPRATMNSMRRSMNMGGAQSSSGDGFKYEIAKYEIDPEMFKEIKKNGLRGDNRIL